MSISTQLLEKLACPCSLHGKLDPVGSGLVSQCCAAPFEISGGIPILLPKNEEQS